jgi:hypothetical protein
MEIGMTNEQLYIFAKVASNMAFLDGMKAANAARERSDLAQAYTESAFEAIAIELEHLAIRATNQPQ